MGLGIVTMVPLYGTEDTEAFQKVEESIPEAVVLEVSQTRGS